MGRTDTSLAPSRSGRTRTRISGLDPTTARQIVVAYEPVWAIGTGKTARPADAQSVHAAVRARLAQRFGEDVARRTRVLYGGSVKPHNAAELFGQEDIDGALVGGASLDATSFLAIVHAAE